MFLSATSRAPFRKNCSLDKCSITSPVFRARSGSVSGSPAFGTSGGPLIPVDFTVPAADEFPDDMIQVMGEEEKEGDLCSIFRLRWFPFQAVSHILGQSHSAFDDVNPGQSQHSDVDESGT